MLRKNVRSFQNYYLNWTQTEPVYKRRTKTVTIKINLKLQCKVHHFLDRIWMACAIFCQKKDSGIFYTPRIELNDLGVSPYFPDGTWCHRDNNGENYYCRRHHCLPEVNIFKLHLKINI